MVSPDGPLGERRGKIGIWLTRTEAECALTVCGLASLGSARGTPKSSHHEEPLTPPNKKRSTKGVEIAALNPYDMLPSRVAECERAMRVLGAERTRTWACYGLSNEEAKKMKCHCQTLSFQVTWSRFPFTASPWTYIIYQKSSSISVRSSTLSKVPCYDSFSYLGKRQYPQSFSLIERAST